MVKVKKKVFELFTGCSGCCQLQGKKSEDLFCSRMNLGGSVESDNPASC
jgi:hypothetical protein